MKYNKPVIAVLATVMMLISSFATQDKFATDWFLIAGSSVTGAQYESDNGVSDFDDITTYVNTTPLTDAQANAACGGLTYMCAVSIPEFTQNNAAILEQADLDYLQANRKARSIIVKLKN